MSVGHRSLPMGVGLGHGGDARAGRGVVRGMKKAALILPILAIITLVGLLTVVMSGGEADSRRRDRATS
jgi:hypothetical protein